MSKDILKDYFSTKPDLKQRGDFEAQLIEKLTEQIYKIERRRKRLAIASISLAALFVLFAICYFIDISAMSEYFAPIQAVVYSLMEVNRLFVIAASMFTIVLISYFHIIYNIELKRLRKELSCKI